MRLTSAVLALAVVTACRAPQPIDPPAPPLGDVSDCTTACSNLRRLSCPEGFGALGGETCERRCAVALELRPLPLACWAAADDVAHALGCGSLRCIH